ncbi:MAG: PAS domain-containing sensor histidine kinase [Sphingomonas sanxanigenens]|uniref:histidine kinase n=1 Tax=Sphingomonas sanxanigenens TaxID=397260 RepID=A0A2W5AGM4_9SPHN|nr:MAG: PAS domain-containing sensor histidine kinase [Sphingomonas sanxanigenens]
MARSMIPKRLLIGSALLLALTIFAFDLFSSLDGAIAVLHIAVILLVAPLGRRAVIAAGLGTGALTIAAFLGGHLDALTDGSLSRFAVSMVAIGITTLLSIRDQATRTTLGEQARILELSHDTVIIRSMDGTILHWNEGAEHLYGWTRREAIGRRRDDLLHCSFPVEEVTAALERDGHWSGEVARTRRDGTRLVLASRWLLRRDPGGRPIGVIESSSDLTEKRRADMERRASEQRYRAIFDTAGFAAWESDWSEAMRILTEAVPPDANAASWLAQHSDVVQAGACAAVIRNANQAAIALFGAPSREALIGSTLRGRYPEDALESMAALLGALAGGERSAEVETKLRTIDGRTVDIVLRVTELLDSRDWSNMLVMAADVTERNEARARLEQTSAELAHAGRVSMLGQLAASIAHEVNQPLTAIINYAKSGRRWLSRPEPDLGEVDACLEKVGANGARAADVIARIRALARKTPPQAERLDLGDLIEDAMALVQREARAADVTMRETGIDEARAVIADRVQVQQVLVNLIINGIQAMRDTPPADRRLDIAAEPMDGGMIRIAVSDSGSGFPGDTARRIFEPFYTTKAEGMGMGLSICRSIIEAQGGRISAENNEGAGATVAFTLPAAAADSPGITS